MHQRDWNIVHLFSALLLAAPVSYANYEGYIKGGEPSLTGMICSFLFVGCWFFYGFLIGKNTKSSLFFFSSFYWGCGLVLFLLGSTGEAFFISIFSTLLYTGPLYGLMHGTNVPPTMTGALSIILMYAISIGSFLVGRRKQKTLL
ncbi:hypothetical protein IMZ31_21950 (plasmid) [Pontibacillus sp. ALD_SL1]|uniref:hypothetical protein n=1 Tax=Pontibacillus sp. ALD_SL1 TaxID=2777185 RepID=UPI001A970323|nr:hypothetical protein [Pontibacillus sp. ALD_SL1]QST02117.1 hypothetical protein IMZ31_21950 [Pontibacillus sp. ALD_SL1]